MEKIRPTHLIVCSPNTYNAADVDNYQTEYTKQIYDKKLMHIMLCFRGNFKENYRLNWYIKNTGYTALKDFINIELSTLYFPSSMPLHICLFFAKKNGLNVVSEDTKTLIIPLISNSRGLHECPFTIHLFLQPDAAERIEGSSPLGEHTTKFTDRNFWMENTYLLDIENVNEKLPFTISKMFPTNYTIINCMIILCPNDDSSCHLINYMSIKYPNVDISIKDKLTCYVVKCSYGITIEFITDIFHKILNFRRDKPDINKSRFLTYFINKS